jgi:hypothetical protein
VDTLWNGPLRSADDLPVRNVDSRGRMVLEMRGFTKGAGHCYSARFADGGRVVLADSCAGDTGVPAYIEIGGEELQLYKGGTSSKLSVGPSAWSTSVLHWMSFDTSVAKVGPDGEVTPVGAGTTVIRVMGASNRSDSILVRVKVDQPVLFGGADTTVLVGSYFPLSVWVTQEYGGLAKFWWDLDGNGVWDDSSAVANGVLKTPAHAFDTVGVRIVRFKVRDTEGNEALAARKITVVGQAGRAISLSPRDTAISIRDSILFRGSAAVAEGSIQTLGFSVKALGISVEEPAGGVDSLRFTRLVEFKNTGKYEAVFWFRDSKGTTWAESSYVVVGTYPPVADAGPDLRASIGDTVLLQGRASDSVGRIVKTEWNIMNQGFRPAPPETLVSVTGPAGRHTCILRVTDDDGLVDVDTLVLDVGAKAVPSGSTLESLSLGPVELTPAFNPAVLAYTAETNQAYVELTATSLQSGSILKVNGLVYTRPVTLPLNEGANQVFLDVTDGSGGSKRTYSLQITRKP